MWRCAHIKGFLKLDGYHPPSYEKYFMEKGEKYEQNKKLDDEYRNISRWTSDSSFF